MIQLEIPAALSRLTDEQEAISVEADTVGQALNELWKRFPKLQSRVLDSQGAVFPYLLLFHNGQKLSRSEFDTQALDEGDTLEIVALAEGG
ncbi:MoaD/ThiS family protein [Thalassoroseus pseudoceratinae]|uniref:MoaD/ThiS family protein n=1 Tax=Thalassoroseus pseudoceratinae TaxID=2713176 RepID=UPI00141D7D19|nr:MoaD/ThiS family protein [Thalassoroseus pseudoceratinae]